MKKLLTTVGLVVFVLGPKLFADTLHKTYGIHLYFDERAFVDVLTLQQSLDGDFISGHMHVPNDFDQDIEQIENLASEGSNFNDLIHFDLFVPKNLSRPTDLIFTYEGKFFDKKKDKIIGTAYFKGTSTFVAYFVGFLRN